MSELRESLDQALRTVVAGEPPVEETISRGKGIRMRRRVAAIASVAAVAVLAAVGYPAVTHLGAAPTPPTTTHRHISVTVVPPGRGAPAGLIASGTIDGKGWRATTSNPATSGGSGNQCLTASGPAFGEGAQLAQDCGPFSTPDGSDPVEFDGLGEGQTEASIGPVGANVSYVLVRLSDGTALKLIPVRVYGIRYVAFATPSSLAVDSATAYLSDGRTLTAIPFNAPDGLPTFGLWQPPGQRLPARASELLASGSADGTTWSVRAYVGPWGTCFVSSPQTACIGNSKPMGTEMIMYPGGSPGTFAGSAAPAVRYITVTLTHGGTLRVTPVAVGGQQYFAFYLAKGQTGQRWTAYDAAGTRLSSGTLG